MSRRNPSVAILGAPYVLATAALVLVPALATVALSFTRTSGVEASRLVGTANFESMLGDSRFWRVVVATVFFTLVSVSARLAAVVGLVVLLVRRGAVAAVARATVFAPTVLPDTALGLVWLWLLDPLHGPAAAIARVAGVEPLPLLLEPAFAQVTVPLVAASRLGEAFVVTLAARRALPRHLTEVAAVEGASPWFTTRTVVLPMLVPVLALVAVRDLVAALGGGLGVATALTAGGPAGATTYLPQFVREDSFAVLEFGRAAAAGTVTFIVALAVAGVVVLLGSRTYRRRGWWIPR